ncbi:hypothetical protein MHI11_08365 [Bacillus sp. FSL K6-3312]|uniref:hypothetical protein n=1 Tax=Bacillus sp. FSL K6-3312 TaxID=2921499 RepID=UPI0030FA85A2
MIKAKVSVTLLALILLTGCLYPENRKTENRVPYEEQLQSVQTAIEEFQKATNGLLPIETKEADTPVYQKYVIDFKRLSPRYLHDVPSTSFEGGGEYMYVLTDVEKKPTVKLLDVKMTQTISELRLRIKIYQDEHTYPPYGKVVSNNLYTLNEKKLGLKSPPTVMSPVTGNSLPLLISPNGEIYVDYRSDFAHILKNTKRKLKPGENIQDVYWQETPFVPAFSVPYTINKKGEPDFLEKKTS